MSPKSPVGDLSFEVVNTVARVTFNCPEFDLCDHGYLYNSLKHVCGEIAANPVVRVVLVSSTGPDFCPGGSNLGNPPGPNGAAAAVGALEKPVVVALLGRVMDTALELALAADIRVGRQETVAAMRQVVNGGFTMDGGIQRLTRLAGPGLAMDMLLTGREITADEAHAHGVISVVAADPLARAEEIALGIARSGTLATRYTKEAVRAASDLTFDQGARLEADLSFLLHGTPERQEGIDSFTERRPPAKPGAPPPVDAP